MEEFCLQLTLSKPEQQKALEEFLSDLKTRFPFIREHRTKVKDEKLIPFELTIEVFLGVTSGISVYLITKCLEKIWERIKQEGIEVRTYNLEQTQGRAEQYLQKMGVRGFSLKSYEDKGAYALFVYETSRGFSYLIRVSKFDLTIFEYAKRRE